MNSCPYCNAPVAADRFICDACSDPSQTVERMDREQAAIDVKALPEGMEDLSSPDLEQTAKAKIVHDQPSLAEEVAATGSSVIQEVESYVVGYKSGTNYVDLEPSDPVNKAIAYKSTSYESNTSGSHPAKQAAPAEGAVATKPVRPAAPAQEGVASQAAATGAPVRERAVSQVVPASTTAQSAQSRDSSRPAQGEKDASQYDSGGYQSGISYFGDDASGVINSSFDSKGVATIGEPEVMRREASPAKAHKSTTPYLTVDQRPASIADRVGSAVAREKWQDQQVHSDFQFANVGAAKALIIILPIIFFMPIMFSSIPGFMISALAIGFFVNLGKKLQANVVDTEWNKFASWVYAKKAPDRREVFLSFIQPPYLVNQIILMDKGENDRTPMLGLKLHVKKNNLNHDIWQGMERYYAGDTKYAANVYMDHSDDLEVVVVEVGKARFWCIPEIDF